MTDTTPTVPPHRLVLEPWAERGRSAELRAMRAEVPDMARWSFTALQQVLRRGETTYTAFFRRGRGFPRFRATSRYHAAAFRVGDGLSFRGTDRRLSIVGVPGRSRPSGTGRSRPAPSSAPARAASGTPLVTRYARLAFEDLNMAGMARSRLARSIHDASWRLLVDLTTYKAVSAGAVVQLVDPRGTSQTWPACGAIAAKPLSLRRHACACGCDLDRDVAAAQVIRDGAFGPGHGLRSPSVRVVA